MISADRRQSAPWVTAAKEKRPAEAGRFFPNSVGPIQLAAINDHLVVVSIPVMVAILLDDDRVPIPMFVAITYNRAISVSVSIMSCTDGHAHRPDTNSNILRVRRHCGTNACNGGDNQSVFHQVLLTL
jgi:hypothetical protein